MTNHRKGDYISYADKRVVRILCVVIACLMGLATLSSCNSKDKMTVSFSTKDEATIDEATIDEIPTTQETTTTQRNEETTIETTIVPTTIQPITEKETTAEVVTEPITENTYEKSEQFEKTYSSAEYSASQFQNSGVIYWGDWQWTYYSERILPGEGLVIPDRHNDENGYVCDGNDYICLASSTLSKGTIISTPFGKDGKIYDSGCASGVIDVYVNW